MAKAFEPVLNKLEYLFIERLPDYIRRVNENYNDGFLLKFFENRSLFSFSNKLPYFKFATEKAVFSNKDRILGNTVFCVNITLFLPSMEEGWKCRAFWRYAEAFQWMVEELNGDDIFFNISILNIINNVIYFKIVL